MGMKGNADDYEKGIDHSVSINSGRGLALRMRKIRKTESRDADVLYHACYSEPYVTLDPSAEQSNGIRILYNVYETLTHYDDKTGEVIPKLAVEWSSNADATEWVFKLRNDVQFHDGEK